MDTNSTTHATSEFSGGDDHGKTRTTFRVAATGVALVLIATLTLIGASPASAEVPYSKGFIPPIVEPGAASHANVDCTADAGKLATVNVSKDGDVPTSHAIPVGSGGTLRLDASADGDNHVIDTDLGGAWSVEVVCPSYTPLTISLLVQMATLEVEARPDIDGTCSTVDNLALIKVGIYQLVCLDVTNHSGKDIRTLVLNSGLKRTEFAFGAGAFPDGDTFTGGVGQSSWYNPDGQTIHDVFAWAEIDTPGSEWFAASLVHSVEVPAAPPAIELRTTVERSSVDACSDGVELIGVESGDDAWVCYQMSNRSALTLDLHFLSGDAVGSLLDADTTSLAPNQSMKYKVKLNPTEDVDVTATWKATYTTFDMTFEATDGANIHVIGSEPPVEDDEPTTTTTAPVDDPADDGDVAPTQDGEEQGTTTTTTATPASTTSTTAVTTNAEVEGITAQPQYAG